MKIFLITSHYPGLQDNALCATLLADSSLLRPKRAFFIPEWDESFSLFPTLALRIGRLGKSISARYAYRYFSGCAPSGIILPEKAVTKLCAGEPLDPLECAYDWSCPLAEWTDFEGIPQDKVVTASSSGQITEWKEADMTIKTEDILALLSKRFTIKTGDIILLPPNPKGIKLNIGEDINIESSGLNTIPLPIK